MTHRPPAALPALLFLSGCGPWIIPFPQPMLAPTDLVAVPDGALRAGVGVTPASVYVVAGETAPAVRPVPGVGIIGYGGVAHLDARYPADPLAGQAQAWLDADLAAAPR